MLKVSVKLIFTIIFFLVPIQNFSETIILNNKNKYNVNIDSEVLINKNGILKFSQIRVSTQFKKWNKKSLNLGFSSDTVWIKFSVIPENNSKKWFLEVAYPLLDSIEFYSMKNETEYQKMLAGDTVPFEKRYLMHRNFIFPIKNTSGIKTYYIKIKTTSSFRVPLHIYSWAGLLKKSNSIQIQSAFLYGILTIMLVFNLLLGISTRESTYIYYILYVGTFIGTSLVMDGTGFEHIWKNVLWLNNCTPLFVASMMIFGYIFTQKFLDLKKYFYFAYILLNILIIQLIICAICSLIVPYNIAIQWSTINAITILPLLLVVSIVCIYKKNRQAWFLLISFLWITLGGTIAGLNRFGVLNDSIFTVWSFQIGIVMQIIFLSLGLADKVNTLKNELQHLNINLENKIEERTEELLIANENLHIAKDALWGEMQLAKKLQTVLIPDNPKIKGFDISVYNQPADEVGGDYYDIINVDGMDWIIIGDVSGHGVSAGLIMMMVQTAIHTVIHKDSSLTPSDLLAKVNSVITSNIKKLNEDKYMTITVLACMKDSTIHFSGLHQDIIIYRGETKTIEAIDTNGIWIGLMDDITNVLQNEYFSINQGDTIFLHTDGITEAWHKDSIKNKRDMEFDMYGNKRMLEVIQKNGNSSPETIKKALLDGLTNYRNDDDITFVILKRTE